MNSNVRIIALGAMMLFSIPTLASNAVGEEGIYYSNSRGENSATVVFAQKKEGVPSCFFERVKVTASNDTFEQQIGGWGTYTSKESWMEVSFQWVNKCGASPTTATTYAQGRVELSSGEFDRDADIPRLNADVEILHDSAVVGIAQVNVGWNKDNPPMEFRRVVPRVVSDFILIKEYAFAQRPIQRVEGSVRIIGRVSFYADGEDVQTASLEKVNRKVVSQPRR